MQESYENYINGSASFNKGLRREDGTLYTQPDFEEKYEDDDYIGDENTEYLENVGGNSLQRLEMFKFLCSISAAKQV